MRLKKLEISGFKSFKNKTIISFDKGLTGLVGPNGCGKSNIVDAILWVTGEQSSKNLRSYSMEDVIFNGSSKFPKGSMAEVSLTLENDNGVFPSKYSSFSEITLTRRIYRSGESEYLINDTFSRLKDIREVFMDSGVRAYAIVEQGEVDRVVLSSPKERRYIIEEAAGISKYKFRKEESEKKIKGAEANIERLDDIIDELSERLAYLEKQVKDAKKYNVLSAQKKEYKIKLLSLKYATAQNEINKIKDEEQNIEKIINDLNETQLSKELYLQEIASKKTGFIKEIKDFSISIGSKKAKYESLIEKISLIERELSDIKQFVDKNNTKINTIKENLNDIDKNIFKLETKKTEIIKNKEILIKTSETEDIDSLKEEKTNLEIEIKNNEEQLAQIQTQNARLQSDINNGIARIDSGNISLEKFNTEKIKLNTEIIKLEESFDILNDNISGFQSKREVLEKKQQDIKNTINLKNTELMSISENIEKASLNISQKKAELMFLESVAFDSGVSEDLLAISDSIITDLINVPQNLQKTIKTYIAKWSSVLIVNNENNLEKIINKSKKANAVFGVLNTEFTNITRTTHGDYIFGEYASKVSHVLDLISYKAEHELIVKTIFNNVFLVDSWKQAIEITKNAKSNDYILITKTGEIVYPDGVFFLGNSKATDFYINRTNKIAKLKTNLVDLSKIVKTSEKKKENILKTLTQLSEEMDNFKGAINGIAIEFATNSSSLESLSNRISDLRTRVSEIEFEIEQQNYENTHLEEDQHIKTKELKENIQQINSLKAKILEKKEVLTKIFADWENKSKQALQLNGQIELLDEKLSSVETELNSALKLKESYQGDIVQISAELGVANEKEILLKTEFEEKNIELKKWDNVEFGDQKLKELEKNIQSLEITELELNKELNDIKLQISESKILFAKTLSDNEQLMREITLIETTLWEKYEIKVVNIDTIKETIDILETKLKSLDNKLNNFGPVNLLAIEEYADIKDRYEFLSTQRADIIKSKENLNRIVKKMDLTSKEKFKEAFDNINDSFQKFFPILFGGGKAELVLNNPDDLLSTGFDIIATLPGKTRQSIRLFSGGEKALTAISLILAVFATRPSPFCILDEVDAPLDEANILRFNQAVKAMASSSQFIIVTHSKTTMSFLDTVYGVTMQDQGVSRMFQVNIDEVKQEYIEQEIPENMIRN